MDVVELVQAVEEWEKVHFIDAPRVWKQVEVDKRLRATIAEFREERWDESPKETVAASCERSP